MHGDLFILLVLLILGFGAFLLTILYGVGWILAACGRLVSRLFRGSSVAPPAIAPPAQRVKPRLCPRAECRKIEQRPAKYCSQCGARLLPPEVESRV